MNKIRKGDKVVVTTGRDKGRQGTVIRVQADDKLLVENVNMVKKHQKPNPQANQALLNPATGKADRVGVKVLADGRKVRFFKSNGEVVDA